MANFMSNFRYHPMFLALLVTMFTLLFPHNGLCAENVAQGVKVIVLDAGHGGYFPGARYNGINEKDINLQVVLKLGALIEKRMPNVKVVYTRTTDMMHSTTLGIDLQERANIAHRNNGDLFISVHSNAMPGKPEVKGTLTLIMGETTGELSRNENALYANNKEELLDMSDQKTATIVRAYIQNLQYTYGMYSEMMGRFIQDEYAKLGYRDLGVRGQPLKVLYSTDMPSVLTEIGFMTNPDELRYISSEEGQNQIVGALFRAIERYIDVVNRSLLVDKPASAEESKSEAPKAEGQTSKEEAKAQPKPKSKPSKSSKLYTIQIMSGKERVELSKINFKSLQGKVWILEIPETTIYKYCYSEFNDRASAQKHLEEVHKDFPQAYIISFEKQKP